MPRLRLDSRAEGSTQPQTSCWSSGWVCLFSEDPSPPKQKITKSITVTPTNGTSKWRVCFWFPFETSQTQGHHQHMTHVIDFFDVPPWHHINRVKEIRRVPVSSFSRHRPHRPHRPHGRKRAEAGPRNQGRFPGPQKAALGPLVDRATRAFGYGSKLNHQELDGRF